MVCDDYYIDKDCRKLFYVRKSFTYQSLILYQQINMNYAQYWIIRYITLSFSMLFICLTIFLIIVEKLYKYLACLFVLFMESSFAIVTLNAMLFTIKFSNGEQYFDQTIDIGTSYNCDQPWKSLCLVQAYLIHSFWLIGFNFSFAITYSIKLILYGEGKKIQQNKNYMIGGCILIPAIIMAIPFIYGGFGPSGFYLITSNREVKFAFLFCGWYKDLDNNDIYYILNNLVPTWILCLSCLYFDIKIYIKRRELEKINVKFNKQQKQIIRTTKIPRLCLIVWFINVVFRTIEIGDFFSQFPYELEVFILIVNSIFDLVPAITCIIFLRYVYRSIPLKKLKWLSSTGKQQNSLFSSEDQFSD